MARRKKQQEPDNHERWLVSYADFITLLFAFFVVMYSISSVNEGKYRVLSDTLTEAFVTPAQSMDPIQIGEPVRTELPVSGEYAGARPTPQGGKDPDSASADAPQPASLTLEQLATSLEQMLQPFIDKELVNVTQTSRGIEVEMRSKLLFESGSARLSQDAFRVLRGVAKAIKPLSNDIQVEGHTDDVPIKTAVFPSNWELSAARAASVVHMFELRGVDSGRMAAIGYGEFRPITDNDDEHGRQKNRRVAMVILAQEQERQALQMFAPPLAGK